MPNKMNAEQMKMFLAMKNLFWGGEFSYWLSQQPIPFAAAREYDEAFEFFQKTTGFKPPSEE